METEKKQQQQKSTQLQENDILDETVPMEHSEKRGNKELIVIKPTSAAYEVNLKVVSLAIWGILGASLK